MRQTATLTPPINFPTDRAHAEPEPPHTPKKSAEQRLVSLDAYRGFVMILMASGGLGLAHFVHVNGLQGGWHAVAYQTDHVEWRGCSLWDLIQPSFTFIVGVAMPFSLAKRRSQGQSFGWLTFHAIVRSLILIALGIFLRSLYPRHTNFMFTDTLAQIGLGYTFAFLLSWTRPRWQAMAVGLILVGYWTAFAAWKIPPATFDYASVGVDAQWYQHCGLRDFSILHPFAAHWDKNTNIAAAFDTWFMNRFPRPDKFKYEPGGYQTLNFIPTLATMLLGLLAGGLMKSPRRPIDKFLWLVIAGLCGLAAGWILDHTGICPSVKRIWTPSWVLFSGGWACLLLAVFYLVVDMARWRWIAFPAVVAGMNSIAMYCLADGGFSDYIRENLNIHFGNGFFDKLSFGGERVIQSMCHALGEAGPTTTLSFAPVIKSAMTLLILWLVIFWMYRRKIFLRI